MEGFAVACGEAAELFEFVEAALDAIALFVALAVERARLLAVALWGDHSGSAHGFGLGHYGVCVVAFVGENGFGLLPLQQFRGGGVLAGLPGGDPEVQRKTVLVGQQMNFGA